MIQSAILLFALAQADEPPYRTSYRVVNVHHHWFDPDPDAARAQVEVMDRAGIAAAVNLDAGRADGTLPAWVEIQKRHPGRLLLFPKFTKKDFEGVQDPGFFDGLVREVERAAAMGAAGVKVWKDLGMTIRDGSGKLLRIDDPRLDPFWARCGELGLVVFIHTADPREYWHPLTPNSLHYGSRTEEDQYYKIPEMPGWEELIAQRDNVVRRHPKTTFIGAHFGSMTFDLAGLGERLDRFPNFHVECAARLRILGRLNPKAVRDFFVKYQDRIMFGTDGAVLRSGRKSRGNILEYPVDDPDWTRIDPKDAAAVRRWQHRQVLYYGRHFEYFETDRLDLVDPAGFGPEWARLAGAKLPPEVLEKFYHGNAERLIRGLRQEPVEVEGQPLAANASRLAEALEYLGRPLPRETREALERAERDARRIQEALDPHVLFHVAGGRASRGAARALLQQGGWTPVLVKVVNDGGAREALRISSPQAGPVYAGVAALSMQRQRQERLRENENLKGEDRFLELEMFSAPPMTPALSGLKVEYAIALLYSSDAGRKEAAIRLGDAEVRVLFEARPGLPVKLAIREADGTPSTARLVFKDKLGHVYPPQPKRLAPDFFFQEQIYRHDGQTVLLPPGEFTMRYSRGPEYRVLEKKVSIAEKPEPIGIKLERWVDAAEYGFYGGDHHIHAAGCAHYTKPSEGVNPDDMFVQVKGEGLNVGCILTWGPSFAHQHRFFSPGPDKLSEPLTLLKYDVEVSGFGSQALGHVCLLNLKEQVYPGADGVKGWPTWTTPVLRWAKKQGAVTGYAHSASGLQIVPASAARRLLELLDADRSGGITRAEAEGRLLPEDFDGADADRDGSLRLDELEKSHDRAADRLPNYAIPEMNSVGAMEIGVTVAQGVCDFISAMDTERIPEWNCWYHLMNCGFPLKVSGETDFPCMSGTRVGQGRVYVRLGKVGRVDFADWCEGLRAGRSYVSDGYAHALDFVVEGRRPGEELRLDAPAPVKVRAKVAFGSQTPLDIPYGTAVSADGRRVLGDTRIRHDAREVLADKTRKVELVVNGLPVATKEVPADDRVHDLEFEVRVDRSSWVALRHFPQLHTNPVNVIVGGKPIRASRRSALWCAETIEQLWRARARAIAPAERDEARKTFDRAVEQYRKLASECPNGS